MSVRLFVGTDKGAFILSSDDRSGWIVTGPVFKGWRVTAAARRGDGSFVAATTSFVYGTAVHSSPDLEHWKQMPAGPAYSEDSGRTLKQIWKLVPDGDSLWAGVDEAGLFRSDDGGASWRALTGLNDRDSRAGWQPGFGGLCLHALVVDRTDPDRLWAGISAVGVFRSLDRGETWTACNEGVPRVLADEHHDEIGWCVHGLVQDPGDPDRLYRQDHLGMFRSADGGDTWERIENGLPSGFGFPLAIDPHTAAVFVSPVESDQARLTPDGDLRVWRSDDGGDSWLARRVGPPGHAVHTTILRGAMDVDGLDPCGVYFGTTSGTVHASSDRGESWATAPCLLPRILCLRAFAADS